MNSREVLRKNVNALIKARGWTSHKPVVVGSEGRITNGTIGRVRDKNGAGNVTLNTVDDLAQFFGKSPSELLSPLMGEGSSPSAVDWREAATLVAKMVPDPKKREALLNFIRYVDLYLEQGERIAESIPDFM